MRRASEEASLSEPRVEGTAALRRVVSRWEIVALVAQRRHRQRRLPAAGGGGGDPRGGERLGGGGGRLRGAAARALLRRGGELLRPPRRRLPLRPHRLRRPDRLRGRLDDLARARRLGGLALGRLRAGARLPAAGGARGSWDAALAIALPLLALTVDQRRRRQGGRAHRGRAGDRQDRPAAGLHRRRRLLPLPRRLGQRRRRADRRRGRSARRRCSCSSPTPASRTPPRRRASSRTRAATCPSPCSRRSSW